MVDIVRPNQVLRAALSESVAGTLAELQINTPTSSAMRLAMRIWAVRFEFSPERHTQPAADVQASSEQIVALSTRNAQTVMPTWSAGGCLARSGLFWDIWASAAAAGGNFHIRHTPFHMSYLPGGLIVADNLLSLYVQGNASLGSTTQVAMELEYDLVELDSETFLAALSVFQTLS